MPQLSVAGAGVVRATIVIPPSGAWYADVELDDGGAPAAGEKTAIVVDDGASWACTVREGGDYDDRSRLRLVGGADGLGSLVPPQAYRNVSLKTILAATLGAVGETLSTASAPAALATPVAAFVRFETTAADTVDDLAALAGVTWRVNLDGTVWIGTGQTAPPPTDYTLIEACPARKTFRIGLQTFDLLPGQTLEGQTVDTVTYTLEGDEARAEVLYG